MNRKNICHQIFVFLACSYLAHQAQAWKVGALFGNKSSTILRSNQVLPAKIGFELVPGDVVHTPNNGRVILVENGSKLIVAPQSHLVVEASDSINKVPLKVQFGALRAKIEKGEAQKYNFKTRTAVAGVRGTEFFVGVGVTTTNICVLEGSVQADMADGDQILVPEGLGISEFSATRPLFAPNSVEQVAHWKELTSEAEELRSIYPNSYEVLAPEHQWGETKFAHRLDLAYCEITDPKSKCFRFHSYHRFHHPFGSGLHLQVTPLLQFGSVDPEALMDSSPPSFRKQDIQLRAYEFILQKNLNSSAYLEAGIKPLSWNQPLFLGPRSFSAEPLAQTFAELRWSRHLLQFGFHKRERRALDGFSSYDLIRYGYDFAVGSDSTSAFQLVQFNEKAEAAALASQFLSPQLQWSGRFGAFLFGANVIYETGRQSRPLEQNFSGSLIDGFAEFHFGSHWRTQLRWIRSSEKYLAISVDSYSLGAANLLGATNLDQKRGLLATSMQLNELLRLELGLEILESFNMTQNSYQASESNLWLQLKGRTGYFKLTQFIHHPAEQRSLNGWLALASMNY